MFATVTRVFFKNPQGSTAEAEEMEHQRELMLGQDGFRGAFVVHVSDTEAMIIRFYDRREQALRIIGKNRNPKLGALFSEQPVRHVGEVLMSATRELDRENVTVETVPH